MERLEFDYNEEKKEYMKLYALEKAKKCRCSEKTKEQWAAGVNDLQEKAIELRKNRAGSVDTTEMEKQHSKLRWNVAVYNGNYAYAEHMAKRNESFGESLLATHKQVGRTLYKEAMREEGAEPNTRKPDSGEDDYTIQDWEEIRDKMFRAKEKYEMKALALSREIDEIKGDAGNILNLANEYEAKAAYAFAMAQPLQPAAYVDPRAAFDSSSDDSDTKSSGSAEEEGSEYSSSSSNSRSESE